MSEKEIINEILNLLKKYYINYKPNKWKSFKNINDFKNIWGNEHGQYYTPEQINQYKNSKKDKLTIKYPELTYVKINGKKHKAIHIPTCVSNDINVHHQYIKKANEIIIKNFSDTDTITIDLNYNFGGKDTVMAAALSPIFNLSKRKRLVNVKTKDKIINGLFMTKIGCYGSTSNPIICGSKKILKNIKNINIIIGETFSAGEVIAIAFKSLVDQFNINFYGYKTGGFTSYIKYFELNTNGGGIEIPVGYMSDAFGNIYKDGVSL